jgi:transposase
VLDGPMTGVAFADVEYFLAPALAPRASILYLPPYSPGLNPSSSSPSSRRGSARPPPQAREEVWSTIARLLDACPSAEFANYFNHCGYGST